MIEQFLAPGMLLLLFCIVELLVIQYKQGKNILDGIKGDNKLLDLPEIVVLFWLPLWITAVLADVFFDYTASDAVWWSFDLVLLFALSGKVGIAAINYKKSKNVEPK